MKRWLSAKIAILNQLRHMRASPFKTFTLHELTMPLIGGEYNHREVLRGLFDLERDRVIEITDGRYIRVMHYMVDDPDVDMVIGLPPAASSPEPMPTRSSDLLL